MAKLSHKKVITLNLIFQKKKKISGSWQVPSGPVSGHGHYGSVKSQIPIPILFPVPLNLWKIYESGFLLKIIKFGFPILVKDLGSS